MTDSKLTVLGYLILATAMEVTGDAIVRMGLTNSAAATKALYFAGGAILLFGYGYALNSAPIEFEKVVGLYIATLFVMWQVVSYLTFGSVPTPAILIGGTLIVIGGLVVAFWQPGGAGPV